MPEDKPKPVFLVPHAFLPGGTHSDLPLLQQLELMDQPEFFLYPTNVYSRFERGTATVSSTVEADDDHDEEVTYEEVPYF